jgi:hypothetical protein
VRRLPGSTVVVASLVLAVAGCSPTDPGATPGGAATDAATAAIQISPKGLDPYIVGATADSLKATNAIGALRDIAGCTGWATAPASGVWASSIQVTLHNGAVALVEIDSPQISTAEGAVVGMSTSELRGLYSGATAELAAAGGGVGIAVPGPADTGLLFRIDGDNVAAIEAGTYTTIQTRFTKGKDC